MRDLSNRKLKDLLADARNGSLILPDFQRGFTWKLNDIKSLIASLFLNYPVGSILTVTESRDLFAERPLLGLAPTEIQSDEATYLLDGQQRLTSCHLVFSDSYKNGEINDSIRRRWFLDLTYLGLKDFNFPIENELIEVFEGEGAIKELKVDRRMRRSPLYQDDNDATLKEYCSNNKLYPLGEKTIGGKIIFSLIQNIAQKGLEDIALQHDFDRESDSFKELENKKEEWVDNLQNLLNNLQNYTIPEIHVERGSSLEKIARVFETVNKTGMTLTLFELLVARATALNTESLKSVIGKVKDEFSTLPTSFSEVERNKFQLESFFLNKFENHYYDAYPKILSCLVQTENDNRESVDISKRAILSTERQKLNTYAKEAAVRLFRSYIFLRHRCGVPWSDQIPYTQMLIPLSLCLNDNVWTSERKLNMLEAWYWSSIFSGRYLESQDQKAKEDAIIAPKFVLGISNEKPTYITRLSTQFMDFQILKDAKEKSKGIFKATLQYVLSRHPFDLQENEKITLYPFEPFTGNNKPLEDHHIIPKDWISNNLSSEMDYVDSCLNRVYISFEANRGMNGIFAQNPHQYLTEISVETIKSLLIPEDLKESNIDSLNLFLEKRYNILKNQVIEEVTQLL
ncbi:hypothetical protein DEU47_1134 [Bacillus sp. AG236]|nr:hypothetical protein DEU47_1134 [Bacillus sp. AG236]